MSLPPLLTYDDAATTCWVHWKSKRQTSCKHYPTSYNSRQLISKTIYWGTRCTVSNSFNPPYFIRTVYSIVSVGFRIGSFDISKYLTFDISYRNFDKSNRSRLALNPMPYLAPVFFTLILNEKLRRVMQHRLSKSYVSILTFRFLVRYPTTY